MAYTLILFERQRCQHIVLEIGGPSLLSMRDVIKTTRHQVLGKAVPLSNCIHLLWDTDTNPIVNFFWESRDLIKNRTENTQIR